MPPIPLAFISGGASDVVGQQAYTIPGEYTWVAPEGVTKVCVVCVGGGGGGVDNYSSGYRTGGGGGALAYKNNITVVPGNSYTVVVGISGRTSSGSGGYGGDSYFINTSIVRAGGGSGGINPAPFNPFAYPISVAGGTFTGDGGGNGGASIGNGGGGAGGYAGNGGRSAMFSFSDDNYPPSTGQSGQGGGGGGGAAGKLNGEGPLEVGGGGGVGILGQGTNGSGGDGYSSTDNNGKGGSGGQNGESKFPPNVYSDPNNVGAKGGSYGGGGTGSTYGGGGLGGPGGVGAVRIIWGTGRAFPSTNTGNL